MADNEKKQLFIYEHDPGRLELLARIQYWILIGIVLWIYGMIAFLCGATSGFISSFWRRGMKVYRIS